MKAILPRPMPPLANVFEASVICANYEFVELTLWGQETVDRSGFPAAGTEDVSFPPASYVGCSLERMRMPDWVRLGMMRI